MSNSTTLCVKCGDFFLTWRTSNYASCVLRSISKAWVVPGWSPEISGAWKLSIRWSSFSRSLQRCSKYCWNWKFRYKLDTAMSWWYHCLQYIFVILSLNLCLTSQLLHRWYHDFTQYPLTIFDSYDIHIPMGINTYPCTLPVCLWVLTRSNSDSYP